MPGDQLHETTSVHLTRGQRLTIHPVSIRALQSRVKLGLRALIPQTRLSAEFFALPIVRAASAWLGIRGL
jgi:hypothetical protein